MPPDLDVVGIGFGPGNIALAVAFEELELGLSAHFFERNSGPSWQSGMLLGGSDIQHNAARDLALPRNPRSRYTFYNYLFERGQLFEYLNLGLPYPFRKDYANYITWVAGEFADQVTYGSEVRAVRAGGDGGRFVEVEFATGERVQARAAVVAPGRRPRIPATFAAVADPRVFHSSLYLHRLDRFSARPRPTVAIIGASQSAVELALDVSRRWPAATVVNIIREFGHRQKDLSPFSGEVYFPAFTDYYYDSTESARRELDRQLRYTNYSAADPDVLNALYVQMYADRLDGVERVRLIRNTAVTGVDVSPGAVRLELTEVHRGETSTVDADVVILATGYHDLTDAAGPQFLPGILDEVAGDVARAPSGHAQIDRDYRLLPSDAGSLPSIYLNGLCETTHGLGDAGSFSLLSLRSATIATGIAKQLANTRGEEAP
ncbi:SidA/IucD/PvdA family monooxygenase [Dactylosporangium sp. NPDC051484]|uniref:SidA/IucD/PvdA family monooxygenase n=1 Tax=Dactylosporangium sp. NPDC051484 TaxID=3154942 RepID=UPI00344FFB45